MIDAVYSRVEAGLAELMAVAANLTETCYRMYSTTKSGLAPEIVTFKSGRDFAPNS